MPTLRTSLVRGEVYPDGLSTAHLGRPGISLPQHTRVWMAGAKTAASLAANCGCVSDRGVAVLDMVSWEGHGGDICVEI